MEFLELYGGLVRDIEAYIPSQCRGGYVVLARSLYDEASVSPKTGCQKLQDCQERDFTMPPNNSDVIIAANCIAETEMLMERVAVEEFNGFKKNEVEELRQAVCSWIATWKNRYIKDGVAHCIYAKKQIDTIISIISEAVLIARTLRYPYKGTIERELLIMHNSMSRASDINPHLFAYIRIFYTRAIDYMKKSKELLVIMNRLPTYERRLQDTENIFIPRDMPLYNVYTSFLHNMNEMISELDII